MARSANRRVDQATDDSLRARRSAPSGRGRCAGLRDANTSNPEPYGEGSVPKRWGGSNFERTSRTQSVANVTKGQRCVAMSFRRPTEGLGGFVEALDDFLRRLMCSCSSWELEIGRAHV